MEYSHIQIKDNEDHHVDFIPKSENEGFVKNIHGKMCAYRAP